MPQGLSTTFSVGQERTADAQSAISGSADSGPIFEFSSESSVDGNANPQLGSTFSSLQISKEPGSVADYRDPMIPTSATFQPAARMLKISSREPKLKTRQLWEGTVVGVRNGGFAAVLRDRTNPSNPDEQGSFNFEDTEISADDLGLINPGSTFYWIIGTEVTPAGQVKNVSMLQFRRVPAWTELRLRRNAERAHRLRESFQEEA